MNENGESNSPAQSAPLFSVVTPSYNQAPWLEGCIESVLSQETDDFEHIIFDNCSTDGTLEILKKYPHLRWTSEPDEGQANALNKGFRAARGKIICWLNTDDRYAPGAFAIVKREMIDRDVIFGNALEKFFDGRPDRIQRPRLARKEDLLQWWDKTASVLQPALFFKRSALAKTGLLREDLHLVMDLEFWWRLAACHEFHFVDEIFAIQLRQPESKTMRLQYRMYREKQAVFGALRREAEGMRFSTLLRERAGLSRRFLLLAQSASQNDSRLARFLLGQSFLENPFRIATPSWWRALAFAALQESKRKV